MVNVWLTDSLPVGYIFLVANNEIDRLLCFLLFRGFFGNSEIAMGTDTLCHHMSSMEMW